MAYLHKRTAKNQKFWVLRYFDYILNKRFEIRCNAHGAVNDVLRKRMLKHYQIIELETKKKFKLFGITEQKTIESVTSEYLDNCIELVKLRKSKEIFKGYLLEHLIIHVFVLSCSLTSVILTISFMLWALICKSF